MKFFSNLLIVALIGLAESIELNCTVYNDDCKLCVQTASNIAFQCSYCPLNGVCSSLGSTLNKCNNSVCISLNSASSCENKKSNACNDVTNLLLGASRTKHGTIYRKADDKAADIYVFAYSWTAEFCYGEMSEWPGCENPESYWKKYFTIHGLWPQYSSGGYPESCTTEPFDTSVPDTIGWSTMVQYWPDVKYETTDPNYDEFWSHEWTKHGTCSGLNQTTYFQTSINLAKSFPTPTSVTNNVGKNVSADTLRNEFGGSPYVALRCDDSKYLSGAYTCWQSLNGMPTAQIVCPSDVQSEDTCTDSTIEVPSF